MGLAALLKRADRHLQDSQLLSIQPADLQGKSARELTGVPLSEVKLSLLLNLERQSSFLGTWKAAGAAGGGDSAEFGDGNRSPWAAALRSGAPAAASSFDCRATRKPLSNAVICKPLSERRHCH